MSEELKPCPFCGSGAKSTAKSYENHPATWVVCCSNPYCGVSPCIELRGDDRERAEKIWNTRPLEDALDARLRAAEAVCEILSEWAGPTMATLHPDIAKALDAWLKARDG